MAFTSVAFTFVALTAWPRGSGHCGTICREVPKHRCGLNKMRNVAGAAVGRASGGLGLPLELSVEAREARQLEHREEGFAAQLGAPVPCRGQTSVDATGRASGMGTRRQGGQQRASPPDGRSCSISVSADLQWTSDQTLRKPRRCIQKYRGVKDHFCEVIKTQRV